MVVPLVDVRREKGREGGKDGAKTTTLTPPVMWAHVIWGRIFVVSSLRGVLGGQRGTLCLHHRRLLVVKELSISRKALLSFVMTRRQKVPLCAVFVVKMEGVGGRGCAEKVAVTVRINLSQEAVHIGFRVGIGDVYVSFLGGTAVDPQASQYRTLEWNGAHVVSWTLSMSILRSRHRCADGKRPK